MTNKRLFDLVRFCRAKLHDDGLISDEEYATLINDPESVGRLEDYDKLNQSLDLYKFFFNLRCQKCGHHGHPDDTCGHCMFKGLIDELNSALHLPFHEDFENFRDRIYDIWDRSQKVFEQYLELCGGAND